MRPVTSRRPRRAVARTPAQTPPFLHAPRPARAGAGQPPCDIARVAPHLRPASPPAAAHAGRKGMPRSPRRPRSQDVNCVPFCPSCMATEKARITLAVQGGEASIGVDASAPIREAVRMALERFGIDGSSMERRARAAEGRIVDRCESLIEEGHAGLARLCVSAHDRVVDDAGGIADMRDLVCFAATRQHTLMHQQRAGMYGTGSGAPTPRAPYADPRGARRGGEVGEP